MPENSNPRPGRPRDPAKDDAAIDATLSLITELGFHGLRIDDVAARAGVPKSTIYRRWPTLLALVTDAYRSAFPDPVSPRTDDPGADLDRYLERILHNITNHPIGRTIPVAAATIMREPDLADDFYEYFVQPYWDGIVDIAERGRESGIFTTAVPSTVVAQALIGSCMFGSVFEGRAPDLGDLVAAAYSLLGYESK
ncbi:MAG TPA: TetR/AcrR family transcriptional regulator [Actinomycetaceae bacterium]|nr:TetR/AcrR family transcriptional regulator [Actinomycetaceae bacterium]